MSDEKIIITPNEAEGLLPAGDTVHNFVNPGVNLLIGADYDRADAIKAFKNAKRIEIGGEQCRNMKHPIVVLGDDGRYSFFEADMAKVDAFEAARVVV
jgi:hypothetical protein